MNAAESWDKPIVGFTVPLRPVATWITAEFATRFHRSQCIPVMAFATGVILAVLAAALIVWAMRSNRAICKVVCVQKDRGHGVVTAGLCQAFRVHPGHAALRCPTSRAPRGRAAKNATTQAPSIPMSELIAPIQAEAGR